MIVAQLKKLKFHQKDSRHTVDQAKNGNRLADELTRRSEGSVKMALAGTVDEAAGLIAGELRHIMDCQRLDPADFTFEIGYSKVEDGVFWEPATILCQDFKVAGNG